MCVCVMYTCSKEMSLEILEARTGGVLEGRTERVFSKQEQIVSVLEMYVMPLVISVMFELKL